MRRRCVLLLPRLVTETREQVVVDEGKPAQGRHSAPVQAVRGPDQGLPRGRRRTGGGRTIIGRQRPCREADGIRERRSRLVVGRRTVEKPVPERGRAGVVQAVGEPDSEGRPLVDGGVDQA